jgi:hypothetical protein
MTMDEQRYVAPPTLYGAPAYARPAAPVAAAPRPFDPDDLPLVAAMTDEERAVLESGPRTDASDADPADMDGSPRSFSLRKLTGLLRGPQR